MMSKITMTMILVASSTVSTTAVHKLKFLSSLYIGPTDQDTAEGVAFDPVTKMAFVASGDATGVRTVDLSDPTSPHLASLGLPFYNVDGTSRCDISDFTPNSVQSIAVLQVDAYDTAVVAAAITSTDRVGNGAIYFFRADTKEFITCESTGVGPEGIHFHHDTGKIMVANEGFDERNSNGDEYGAGDMVDPAGSVTVCSTAVSNDDTLTVSCTTRDLRPEYTNGDSDTYCSGGCDASESGCQNVGHRITHYQDQGIRLYGPGLLNEGDVFSRVMEPENLAITEDGLYAFTVFQDNNAYGIFDMSTDMWVKFGGLGTIEMTMDAEDNDDEIDIKSEWNGLSIHGMFLPDAVASFTDNGVYYFVTANEGDTKDCSTMIVGNQTWTEDECEDWADDYDHPEGEEIDIRRLQTSPASVDFGRLATSPYMPSNFARDACPTVACGTSSTLRETCGTGDASMNSSYASQEYELTPGNDGLGGAMGIGARSITIWSWDGSANGEVTKVWDSGSKFEMLTGGGDVHITDQDLCGLCLSTPSEDNCENCPFNSDRSPPSFERRTDNKGPEPECVEVGTLADGTRLVFAGLERTGGIATFNIDNPAAPVYQDFLNVRNWKVGDDLDGTAYLDNDEYNLHDGPEQLVFVSEANSPIGHPLLLAAHPYYGRVSVYMIESGDARTTDGSCYSTATCGYFTTAQGGTGSELVSSVCDVVSESKRADFEACVDDDSSSSSDDDDTAIVVVAVVIPVAVVLLVLAAVGIYFAQRMGRESGYRKALNEKRDTEIVKRGATAP